MVYYIGFVICGNMGFKVRKLINDIDRDCRLTNISTKRPNPHITLISPFDTNEEKKILDDFYEVCSKFSFLDFKLGSFGTFKKNNIVYVQVIPSNNLNSFRLNLINKYCKYCKLKSINYNKIYPFHITLAKRLKNFEIKKILKYLVKKKLFYEKCNIYRIAIIKNGKVFCEYDFSEKKMYFM